MNYFEVQDRRLVWRNHGETLFVDPWGPDSLRVRSSVMAEPEDSRFALLDPVPFEDTEIRLLSERLAEIRCGKLTARLEVCGWKEIAVITFLNQRGEILLQETDGENALTLRARKFEPRLGADWRLTATFRGMDGERIYGMGQYQEEYLDWKGCTLELAHRNSQASVPMLQSNRGYGFLWHNPAIGTVSFGRNRTTWTADSTKQP